MLPLPPGALAGVKVVDFTQMLSGPFCTMLLADLGADVIKVEPLVGDMGRPHQPFHPDDHLRAYGGRFQSVNRGKRSIAVDLKTEAGREVVLRLVRDADVLAENFRPGVMERFGLAYETLRELNPRLVYGCIRGFGDPRTGASPYGDWPSFDIVAQAMGGLMSATGPGPGEPMKVGPAVGDIVPGIFAALGIAAAVIHAGKTGEGQFVDVAMTDAVLAISDLIVSRYSYLGEICEPEGNAHAYLYPFDLFPTADGAVVLGAVTDRNWLDLCAIMGRADLAADMSLAGAAGRAAQRPRLRAAVCAWTTARTRAEVLAALGGQVPCGPVNDMAALVSDPHTGARDMLAAVEHPGLDVPVLVPNSPIKMTATPAGVRGRSPLLGEHTDEVLRAHDFAVGEIATLRGAGVIA